MKPLTEDQKKVMLQLGDTESVHEVVPADVLQQLIELGLVYKRNDGHLDFTDSGEAVYESLTKKISN